MPSPQARVGARIRDTRLALGWSQYDLAQRAGLSTNYIGQIERGLRDISVSVLSRIADAMSQPPAQLFNSPLDPTHGITSLYTCLSDDNRDLLVAFARLLAERQGRASLAAEPEKPE